MYHEVVKQFQVVELPVKIYEKQFTTQNVSPFDHLWITNNLAKNVHRRPEQQRKGDCSPKSSLVNSLDKVVLKTNNSSPHEEFVHDYAINQ